MNEFLGIAALITASGWAIMAVLNGISAVIWARRKDPKNTSSDRARLTPRPTSSLIKSMLDREGV